MVNRAVGRAVLRGVRFFSQGAAHWLLPARCLICDSSRCATGTLCDTCYLLVINQRLERIHCCARCALPLATKGAPALYCGWCIRARPAFDRCIAGAVYAPATAKLVNGLKHQHRLANAATIALEMSRAVAVAYGERKLAAKCIDMVVPVPLHKNRLRERGFNQAVEIARPLCRDLALPLAINACHRVNDARAQQSLTRKKRAINLRGAFLCSDEVAGKRIAVVDDVVTTTSTANSVAQCLIKAGALSCEVWCFARTPAPD